MHALIQDVRYAARSLGKNPGFTALAAICMALGIAANVLVYSPVNALLIRPLPYREPDRIVHLNTWLTTEAKENYSSWSWADYSDVMAATTAVFSESAAFRGGEWNLGGIAEPERVGGARVTASLFPMLGFTPSLGRFFRSDEERSRVAVISHALWQRKFGSNTDVVGRSILINGASYQVVGVMQKGVRFPETEDLWLPPELTEQQANDRGIWMWNVYARARPGVTLLSAQQRVVGVMRTLAQRYPKTNSSTSAWAMWAADDVRNEVRTIFVTMLGAVAFVLLIACSNVANMLLARGSGRQRELAVRLSLGATRTRLVRQLLTESVLLAIVGGALGVALGSWGVDALMAWALPPDVPFWMRFDVDRGIIVATLFVTLISGLIFGIAPALRLSRPDLAQTLKDAGGRGGSASRQLGRLRSTLVVAQLSLSIVLLGGAALMVKSFLRTQHADMGYDPNGVLVGRLALAGDRYASETARRATREQLLVGLRAIPGVAAAGLAAWIPVEDCCNADIYKVSGRNYGPNEQPSATMNAVSPRYFETMGVSVLQGRDFSDADGPEDAKVAIVSSAFANKEWPQGTALGQTLTIGSDSTPVTVVGVVENVVVRKISDGTQRFAHIYRPLAQSAGSAIGVVLKTNGDEASLVPALRDVVKRIDPALPLSHVKPMRQSIRERMFEGRVYGTMFAVFGLAALTLAALGLYGVMSYMVAQRTQEVGVRMALGARPSDVVRMILGDGGRLVFLGIAIGLPASLALAQALKGALYGVTATDPLTFLLTPIALAIAAFVSVLVPLLRAVRVQPVVALRND